MKVTCKFLSHMKLDQSYSLLSARDVSVVLEFFKALDVRGEMALDGKIKSLAATLICMCACTIHTAVAISCRHPVLCIYAQCNRPE